MQDSLPSGSSQTRRVTFVQTGIHERAGYVPSATDCNDGVEAMRSFPFGDTDAKW